MWQYFFHVSYSVSLQIFVSIVTFMWTHESLAFSVHWEKVMSFFAVECSDFKPINNHVWSLVCKKAKSFYWHSETIRFLTSRKKGMSFLATQYFIFFSSLRKGNVLFVECSGCKKAVSFYQKLEHFKFKINLLHWKRACPFCMSIVLVEDCWGFQQSWL